jgi:hypothetical protein
MWREILVGQQDSCDAGTSASPIFHVELYVQLSLYCMPDELADGTLQILSGAFLEPIYFVKLHPKSTNPHRFGAVSIVRVAESTCRYTIQRDQKSLGHDFLAGVETRGRMTSRRATCPGPDDPRVESRLANRVRNGILTQKRTTFDPVSYQSVICVCAMSRENSVMIKNRRRGPRDGFRGQRFLGSQVFVTESCLPVNRPHENPEKRP